ncbi:MAG TPA: TonB-dependent receptor [Steroidobacteraceae bacterium]|nr:TonB-dependent receptor [Steroidobacteraceae bacterium]
MTRSRIRKIARVRSTPHARVLASAVPLASAISAILASTSPVYAQQQASNDVLEQITVTAQKREENLQNVPVSITAIGSEKIEELHLNDFADFATFLPSLSYQSGGQSGGSGFARPYMRGIASGGDGNHSASPPSVGMYLDEQPVTTISGALDIHMYDIARVEALAGPQGTLYGASSEAGTVRIITNKPDPSGFQAGYDLEGSSVDHGGTGYSAEGFANIPISDNAAVRLVGWYEDIPGFIDNIHGTLTYPTSLATIDNANRVKKDYNDGEVYGGRAALKVDLGDNWTITPGVMGQWSKTNGSYGYRIGEPFEITRFNPENVDDHWWQAALTVEGKFSNFDIVYAGSYLNREDWTHSDYVDYSYFYDSCCGYGSYIFDNTGTPIDPTQFIVGHDRYKMQSHELRISSPPDQRFRFVAGLYYARNQHDIEQRYEINNLAQSLWVTGWPDTWWLTEQVRVDKDYAAFGELTYDITDKLSVTGGIRFYKYENSLEGFFGFGLTNDFTSATGEKSCFPGSTSSVNGGPCTNLDKDVDDTGNTPKVNVTYKFTDQALVYATYSKGFRPGGVNRVGTTQPYKADFLKNYEVGWKTTWAGNRLRWNGAIFQEDWDDFQFAFLGPNSVTIVANAGKARSRGIETELNWAATAGLTLSLGGTYIDAQLTQPYCGTLDASGNDANPCVDGNGDPAPFKAEDGQQLPVTPKFKGNFIARYLFNVGSLNAHVQGAVAYVGSREPELRTVQRDILGEIPSYTVTNLAAGVGSGKWTLELFINNAFDEKGQVDRWAQCDATVCGQEGTYITPIPTRTYGLKFGQQF